MFDPVPVTPTSIEAAKAAALQELRETAVALAAARGHQLGRWHRVEQAEDVEVAYCQQCFRPAAIEILRDPHLAGPALSEACQRRRPDAFLADTHPGDLGGL